MDALDEAYNVLEVSDSLIAQLKKDSKTSFFLSCFFLSLMMMNITEIAYLTVTYTYTCYPLSSTFTYVHLALCSTEEKVAKLSAGPKFLPLAHPLFFQSCGIKRVASPLL